MWAIATEQDNLWVKWVHEVYIKEEEWWDYNPPPDCCWYWKQAFKVKTELKRYYSEQDLKRMNRMSISSTYEKMIEVSNVVQWDKMHGLEKAAYS